MALQVDIITLFPEIFTGLDISIPGRARRAGLWDMRLFPLRDYAINKYGQVDDTPYGGEAGMVLRPEPLLAALQATGVEESAGMVVHLSADGEVLTHALASELGQLSHLVLLCGHYKGVDERIRHAHVDREISIGDFVLSGGEFAALVLVDAIVRLLPGAIGDRESAETDSHAQGGLGWPLYTRPATFCGMEVPPVLLSGDKAKIAAWQREQAILRTRERRPDLLEKMHLSDKEQAKFRELY